MVALATHSFGAVSQSLDVLSLLASEDVDGGHRTRTGGLTSLIQSGHGFRTLLRPGGWILRCVEELVVGRLMAGGGCP